MSIFEAHNMPFAVAFVLVLLLAMAQALGLGDFLGGDAEADLTADVEGQAVPEAGTLDGLSTLLGIGRVPFTVWLALFLFGGDMIHNFAVALIVGVGVGTYSSIYIASNILVYLKLSREDLIVPVKENEELDQLP